MRIIGDMHGHFDAYFDFIRSLGNSPSIQVGDLGVGIRGFNFPEKVDGPHFFIRGNHDNPEVCQKHPNYLGDFGFDQLLGVFFVSGGYSIDRVYQLMTDDYYPDEELTYMQLERAIGEYETVKPEIMVTHDCPHSVLGYHNRTCYALQAMLEIHRPRLWLFGHHHEGFTKEIDGTSFICVAQDTFVDI